MDLDDMGVAYRQFDDLGGVLAWLTELGAKTVIFDVEPLRPGELGPRSGGGRAPPCGLPLRCRTFGR